MRNIYFFNIIKRVGYFIDWVGGNLCHIFFFNTSVTFNTFLDLWFLIFQFPGNFVLYGEKKQNASKINLNLISTKQEKK
jgi:hypothetical protein